MKAFEQREVDGFIARAYIFFDPINQRFVRVVFRFEEGARHAVPRMLATAEISDGMDEMGERRWLDALGAGADAQRYISMVAMFRDELEAATSGQKART